MRELFVNKYPRVVSRGFWDIGSTAPTLGKVRLPYARPGPAYPKIFPLPEKKRLILKDLIRQMCENNIARGPVNSSTGAPVFLVDRKDSSKPARMVVALTRENECLADPPVVILPSTDKILSKMANNIYLISQIDLRQGFYHLKVDERDLHKSTIATPFGSYEILVVLMGWTIGPALFNSHISRTLFTDPRTSRPCDMLDPYIVLFLDDINVVTPFTINHEESVKLHFQILDRVLYRLHFHNWKVNCEKLVVGDREAKILGWIVRDGELQADPKRISDITNSVFPTSRKGLQAFCALVNCLRRVMPLEAAQELSKLYELTSSKKEYSPTTEHKTAFEATKKYLTSKPLYVKLPDPNCVKVMFSDASSNIIGGVLAQVRFEAPNIETRYREENQGENFSKFDKLGRYLKSTPYRVKLDKCVGQGRRDGAIRAILAQLEMLGLRNYPKTEEEFQGSLNIQRDQLVKPGLDGRFHQVRDETDVFYHTIGLSSLYLGRNIYLVEARAKEGKIKLFPGELEGKEEIPPLFIGAVRHEHPDRASDLELPTWYSLVVHDLSPHTNFTSFDVAVNYWKELDQRQLFEEIKKQLATRKGKKPTLEIIAYMSKVIPPALAKRPIFEKEALGLLTNLHTTRDMHVGSPAVLAILDSATAYFLFSKNIAETVHKVHRWSVSLREKYSNTLLYAVPSQANIADFLSRNFEVAKPEKVNIELLYQQVTNKPELEGEFFSHDEMELEVEKLEEMGQIKHLEAPKPCLNAVNTRNVTRERDHSNIDALNSVLNPIKILQKTLSVSKLAEAQMSDPNLLHEYEKALANPTEDTKIENNLLMKNTRWGWKIWVPPTLEGKIMALEHLKGGHFSGRDGLKDIVQTNYYFPGLPDKIADFVKGCWNCRLVKGRRGKSILQGTSVAPSHAFHIIYADLISGMPGNKMKYTDVLTIVCPLTKFLCIFGLKSSASAAVLEHFKTFFLLTGYRTRVLFTDNGTTFREKSFLRFMASVGVRCAATTVFHSQARGQVEIFNYLLEKVLKGMFLTQKSYSWSDLAWLAAAMINTSVHRSTQVAPYAAVFGNDALAQGNLGTHLTPAAAPLIQDASLKAHVEELSSFLSKMQKTLQRRIEQAKLRTWASANKHRVAHHFQVGDIVFIKDNRLPAPGVNTKLRPRLQKSPFVVEKVNTHILSLCRLVDRFCTRVTPGDVVKYEPSKPDLFQDIPPAVLRELGSTLSVEQLTNLASVDQLPALFTENLSAAKLESTEEGGQSPATGAQAEERAGPAGADPTQEDDDDEDDGGLDLDLAGEDKTVQFQEDT